MCLLGSMTLTRNSGVRIMTKKLVTLGAYFICFIMGYRIYPIWNEMKYGKEGFHDKHQWSIIQGYSWKYRDMENSKPYIIEETKIGKHVYDNDLPIVAFPIKGKQKGYVAILSRAQGGAMVKALPVADFELTKEIYEEIKAQVSLSDDVDTFIASHIIDQK